MAHFDPSVLDLALYFADDNGKLASCWVPNAIYTQQPCAMEPAWKMGDLLEVELSAGTVHYVLNLSRLITPGVGPLPPSFGMAGALAALAVPGPKDLVIVPPDDPNQACVVPRAVYTDPTKCPPIGKDQDSADLDFLALNQGVVLANLPKVTTPSGWTCFLLSLVSLRSGALPGVPGLDKNAYFTKALDDHDADGSGP